MCWRNKRILSLYEWKRNENDVYEFNATILWFFYPKQMKHQISDRLHTDLAKLSTVKMKVWWQGSHLRQSAGKVKASKYFPVDHTVLVQPHHNQLNKAEYEKQRKSSMELSYRRWDERVSSFTYPCWLRVTTVCRQVKCQYMKSRLEINCWRVTMNIAQMGIFLSAMQVYWIRMHTNATDCRITIPAKRRPTTPYDIDSWLYEQWLKASYTIWSSSICPFICRWARFCDAIAT